MNFTAMLLLLASPLFACDIETQLLVHDSSALTEASDITRVGDTYYVVKDEKFSLTKVYQDGSLEVVGVTTGTDSDHEAIFRLPGDTNDAEPTLVVCGEDTEECSPYFGGLKQETWSLVDGGDNCHASINFGNNKGVEGALGLANAQGDTFMLALIEGTGKIVTYRLTNEQWVSEGCTNVPEDMDDYSGMAFALSEDTQPRLVVTSQKSRALWVGEVLGLKADGTFEGNFRFDGSGSRYNFDSDFKGVEGVFVESVDASGGMTGVICSDDQGNGNFADSVHRFQLVCSPSTTDMTTTDSSTTDISTTLPTSTVTVQDEYFSTEEGACPEEDQFITSKTQCEAAAQALGLTDVTATRKESEDHPFGCYYFNDRLWLNSDDENESEEAEDDGYLHLCVREVTVVVTRSPTTTTESPTAATAEPTEVTMEPTVATSEPTSKTKPSSTSTRAPTSAATGEPTTTSSPSMAPSTTTMAPSAFSPVTTHEPTSRSTSLEPTTTIMDANSSFCHAFLLAAVITMLTL